MKPFVEYATRPAMPGWVLRLATSLQRRDPRRRGRPNRLSPHMLRDIGLSDDARGDPLYGSARRRM